MTATDTSLLRAGIELQHEVDQFCYHEARLLDERRYDEWLELFTEDIHYWMPTRYNRLRREARREFSAPNETSFFDEDYDSLRRRILRLETGMAWAEDPPSRVRHLFTNITVVPTAEPDVYEVLSNFLLYRTRLADDAEFFVGAREDVLRRAPEAAAGFLIARRQVILDQTTLSAKNLSMFF